MKLSDSKLESNIAPTAIGKAHVLVIPCPGQGHVMPLMELSHRLVDRGIKVTFVNTEFIHARVVAALEKNGYGGGGGRIRLVSIPDGLGSEERNQSAKLCEAIYGAIPGHLEKLVRKMSNRVEDKITCIIADKSMGSAFVIAEKMKIPAAAFWPAATATFASSLLIPKMIEDGIIDANGIPFNEIQKFWLSPSMPEMNPTHLFWNCIGDSTSRQILFKFICKNNENLKLAKWHICNSFYDIEPSAFDLIPQAIPIGPLLSSSAPARPAGHFWREDSTCLSWLDRHPPGSIIYVAFGSLTILNLKQLHELALGLELTRRPFLWVIRPDLMDRSTAAYLEGFEARVAHQGKVVSWAPQQKVLAHPSVGCFMSHCGWNSTIEGLSNGIPFLCWPYFADQFLNQAYICDVWRIGISLNPDGSGTITKEEIKEKVECLMGDEGVKARAMELKEMAKKAVSKGGTSWENLNDFAESFIQ